VRITAIGFSASGKDLPARKRPAWSAEFDARTTAPGSGSGNVSVWHRRPRWIRCPERPRKNARATTADHKTFTKSPASRLAMAQTHGQAAIGATELLEDDLARYVGQRQVQQHDVGHDVFGILSAPAGRRAEPLRPPRPAGRERPPTARQATEPWSKRAALGYGPQRPRARAARRTMCQPT
jgi:hypothetical protein